MLPLFQIFIPKPKISLQFPPGIKYNILGSSSISIVNFSHIVFFSYVPPCHVVSLSSFCLLGFFLVWGRKFSLPVPSVAGLSCTIQLDRWRIKKENVFPMFIFSPLIIDKVNVTSYSLWSCKSFWHFICTLIVHFCLLLVNRVARGVSDSLVMWLCGITHHY